MLKMFEVEVFINENGNITLRQQSMYEDANIVEIDSSQAEAVTSAIIACAEKIEEKS